MTPVFLDFETYWGSDYTLSKMSQIEYVMDDRFEAISCGIKVGGGDTVVYVGDEIGPALAAIDWEDSIAVAHNMAFDGLILAWRYGYTPALWACTLCMARPLHGKDVGGSLKYLSEYYGYQPKGVLQTKGRRLADLLPAEIAALREYNVTDVDICARLFKVFLPVTSLGELRLIDRTLRMALEPRLEADTVLLEHGLRAERARKEKALQRLSVRLHMHPNELRQELASAQKFSALLESWGVEVPTKPSPATGKPIPALAKTDYGMQDLLEHEDELVRTASELRLDVKSTILETRLETMVSLAAASGGKMPVTLRYYGATNTGRWSGDTWNPQNLPRVNPNQFKLTDVLRLSLKAPEGHQIVVADLAGIELRVNMFLWQVPYAMELFRADPDKADLYKAFAATLYRVPVDQVDKTMRQMGKLAHLGLGYGASANTFRRVAKTMGGVEVPQTEAENIVNVWREAHQEVVQGWWKCTGALHAMYSGREMAIDPWGLCRTGKDHIILPRGILRYTDLRQENDSTGKPNWVYGKGRYKTKIYSSKLDENLVQALSRYVLSDIMLAYADTELGQRYPIVHCVHDELVVVAADNDAQAVLDLLLTLMKTPPTWWPELVTSAEGSFAQRYGEAK